MIDKIREKLSSIEGIALKNMQINFGNENVIEIEIKKVQDFPKWDYFCERLSRNTDSVHIVKKYPTLTFKMSLDRDILKVGLDALYDALTAEYYQINKPKESTVTIIAKVTNLCNLDCKYCYDKPFRDCLGHNGFLDLEKIDHAIKMASEYAERVVLIWHGGEPTLVGTEYYDKIYREIIPKYPYTIFENDIQSNGTLIDDKWCECFERNGMKLGSSYNATQEDLRQNYVGDGESAETKLIHQAFQNVKHAIDMGVVSGVIDVFTKENHEQMKEIYEFYKKEGVDASFNEINAAGEANKHQFLFTTKEDRQKYRKETLDYFIHWINDKDEGAFIDRYTSEYMQLLLTGEAHVCHNGNHCLYHWFGLNSNGDVYPCDRALPEKYRIGNIMDFNSLNELYASPKYQQYANERNKKLETKCANCDISPYCHGGCPMVDIDANGDASKANSYACKMQRINVECVYRALFETTINKCNRYVRWFMIKNCLFFPKEIPILIEKLGLTESFKDYDYNSDGALKLSSKEFKLFTAINSANSNNWITESYYSMYGIEKQDILEDNRFDIAVKELKKRAELLEKQLLGNKECE